MPYRGPNIMIALMMMMFCTIPVMAGAANLPTACNTPVIQCAITVRTAIGNSIVVRSTVSANASPENPGATSRTTGRAKTMPATMSALEMMKHALMIELTEANAASRPRRRSRSAKTGTNVVVTAGPTPISINVGTIIATKYASVV